MKTTVFKVFIITASLILFSIISSSAKQYYYTQLPYIGQGYWSNEGDAWVSDINNSGQVIGTTREINGVFHVRAFLWSEDKGLQLIGNAPSDQGITRGHAVNDKGQVVGHGIFGLPSITIPFIWSEDIGIQYIELPTNYSHGSAAAINNKGDIIGSIWMGYSGPSETVIWNDIEKDPSIIDRSYFNYLNLNSISHNGNVVGRGYDDFNNPTPIIWTVKNGLQSISPPYLPGYNASGANDIAENGRIVGQSRLSSPSAFYYRAVLWSGGDIENLGVLNGKDNSSAYGINNSKEVVGVSFNSVCDPYGSCSWGEGKAFIWSEKTQIMDLNNLVVDLPTNVVLYVAVAINNQGQIVAEGLNESTGKTVFAVLTPFEDE